jgi:hypothetical protein
VSAIQINPNTEQSITAVKSVLTGSGAGVGAPVSLAFCMVVFTRRYWLPAFMVRSRRAPRTLGGDGRGTKVGKP